MKKIALIDDHILVSAALKSALSLLFPESEINAYPSGEAFLERKKEWIPDIIISDLFMPGLQGVDFIEALSKSVDKDTKIIILSAFMDVNTSKNAIKHGVSGIVSKNAPIEELAEAIKVVGTGEVYVSQELSRKLIKNIFVEEQVNVRLTPREKEVLQQVCKGATMKEIAYNMDLSINTIHSFQKNILKKFNVNRTTDLVVAAMKAGLFNTDSAH